MKKKIISVVLVAVMALCLLPTMTFAATPVSTWTELQDAFNAGGDFELSTDVIASTSDTRLEVPSGKTVTLDLNGHAINRNLTSAKDYGGVIVVKGTLTVNDTSNPSTGQIRGGFTYDSDFKGGGINVKSGGSLTLNGGSICYNKSAAGVTSYGGGVCVAGGGTFTMTGGSIDNNSCGWIGGGVCVGVDGSTNSTVSLLGGSITDNRAYKTLGGGVYAYCPLTLGGTIVIKNNVANTIGTSYTSNLQFLDSPPQIASLSTTTPLAPGADIGVYSGTSNRSVTIVNSTGAASFKQYFKSDVATLAVATAYGDNKHIYLAKPPVLIAGSVSRANDANATVKFTSSAGGSYYYAVVPSGAAAPTIDVSGRGTSCTTSETSIALTNLTAGAKDIYIIVKDSSNFLSSETFKIAIPAPVPYTYNTPAPSTINGVTATVTYSPVSPEMSGTSVTATVTLTGTATKAGVQVIDLTSTQAGLSSSAKMVSVTAGQDLTTTPETKTFTFTVPSQNVDDLTLTHSFRNLLGSVSLSTASPAVGGAVTLTLDPAAATASYQWYTNTTGSTTGGTPVAGATGASYTPTNSEVGKYLYIVATGTGSYAGEAKAVTAKAVVPSVAISPSATLVKGSAPTNEKFIIGEGLSGFTTGDLSSLTVDGTVVAQGANTYSVVTGSLVITFAKSYLDTLSVGSHTIAVTLTGVYAGVYTTTITVTAPSAPGRTNPSTGVSCR